MNLSKEEFKIKVFYHHPLPFLWKALQIVVVSFPFFFVVSFFNGVLSFAQLYFAYAIIFFCFFALLVYFALVYFLDRLVITNRRILYIHWEGLFSRKEKEIGLHDSFDIKTVEKGILSSLKLFDYGIFQIESEASTVPIVFADAKDPEGIKDFIYHIDLKPSSIKELSFKMPYDRKGKTPEEKSRVSKNQ